MNKLNYPLVVFLLLIIKLSNGQYLYYNDLLTLQELNKEAIVDSFMKAQGFRKNGSSFGGQGSSFTYVSEKVFKFKSRRGLQQEDQNQVRKYFEGWPILTNKGISFTTNSKLYYDSLSSHVRSLGFYVDYSRRDPYLYEGMIKAYKSNAFPGMYIEISKGKRRTYNDSYMIYEFSMYPYDSVKYNAVKVRDSMENKKEESEMLSKKENVPADKNNPQSIKHVQGKVTSISEIREGKIGEFNDIPNPDDIKLNFVLDDKKDFTYGFSIKNKNAVMKKTILDAYNKKKSVKVDYIEVDRELKTIKVISQN